MPSSTVENYVKTIYMAQQAKPRTLVSMGHLASAMKVTPGTATTMIKTLADAELVHYEPRSGVRLTKGGEQLALHVLRRHRLVELFLVQILGLDWSQVHAEAESLEHVISEPVLERIDDILGYPSFDPHGDPIPSAQGTVSKRELQSLAESPQGATLLISRVVDQDPEFLRFADKQGLVPGAELTLEHRDELADAVSIQRADGGKTTLGLAAASKILVEPT